MILLGHDWQRCAEPPVAHDVTLYRDERGLWCWKCWDCPHKGYGNVEARQQENARRHALYGGYS